MTKCYLDSNFLVYIKNGDSPDNKKAIDILRKLISQEIPLFISSLVLDEYLHIIRLKLIRGKEKLIFEKLLQALKDVLEIPNVSIINPPVDSENQLKVVSIMKHFFLRPRDAYHLLIMQANNIDGFATFDTDFKKVFAAKVLTKA